MKFKVGDRVRIKEEYNSQFKYSNRDGTVTNIYNYLWISVLWDTVSTQIYIYKEYILEYAIEPLHFSFQDIDNLFNETLETLQPQAPAKNFQKEHI